MLNKKSEASQGRKLDIEALQNSESRYRRLFETAQDGILILDAETGQIADVNPFLMDILGYPFEELLGKNLWEIGAFKDTEKSRAAFSELQTKEYVRYEHLPLKTKAGRHVDVEFVSNVYLVNNKKVIQCNIRDITERKHLEKALKQSYAELEMRVDERTAELGKTNTRLTAKIMEHRRTEDALKESEKHLKHLSSKLLAAQEEERKRIAHELHDSLGQSLITIKLMSESILHRTRKVGGKTIAESLEALVSVIQSAVEETRRIQLALRPSILDDLGIIAAATWFCREFQETHSSIRIEQQFHIQESEIPDRLKTPLFRVSQEALSNIAKHSQANHVYLSLKKAEGAIELVVRDNGSGFDPDEALSRDCLKRGLGLTSMRERAEFSGGSINIQSTKGAGTVILVSWPIEASRV